jgi:hypothetical protein
MSILNEVLIIIRLLKLFWIFQDLKSDIEAHTMSNGGMMHCAGPVHVQPQQHGVHFMQPQQQPASTMLEGCSERRATRAMATAVSTVRTPICAF